MFITSFGEQNITYKCCSNFLIHLSITHYSPLKDYLENEYTDYQTLKNSIVFSKIDTICDTRNGIAHGVQSVQLLGETVLNEHIDFFILYSKSLLNMLHDCFLEF